MYSFFCVVLGKIYALNTMLLFATRLRHKNTHSLNKQIQPLVKPAKKKSFAVVVVVECLKTIHIFCTIKQITNDIHIIKVVWKSVSTSPISYLIFHNKPQ